MRIGPLQIARAATTGPRAPVREQGASGVVNLDGFLQELEYNQDLRGAKRYENFERMRSDGSVVEALGHITAPLLDATWTVEPASTSADDLVVAEACRHAFFEWPVQPWSEYLDQALDYLVFGNMPFELAEHVVDSDLEVPRPDADPIPVASRQWLTFRRFAQRLPSTISRWNVDDQEELESVGQLTWRADRPVEITIPADQLVLFVNQKRGADFTGRSLLRGAYKHWVLKELVEKIEIVALERLGVGILVGYPSNARANDDAVLSRMEEILRDVRAGANTYIVSPGPKGQSSAAGQDGFLFEILSPTGSPPDFDKAKTYHRGEIKGSVLVRFAELGHGQTGARATSDSQSEVWKSALRAVANHVGETNAGPIRRFVDANFPRVTRYPKLVANDIESKSLAEFAETHFRLLNGGGIRPDRGYYRYVRESIGAPPEDDPAELDQREQNARDQLAGANEDGPQHDPAQQQQGASQ